MPHSAGSQQHFSSKTKTQLIEELEELRYRVRALEQSARDREHEARMRFLLSTGPAVIYACKAEGDFPITFMSDYVKAQLGYEPDDFTSDPGFWASRIHPEDAPRFFADLEHLFETDSHVHEYRFRHKDGTYLWMRDELKLVRDGEGEPREIVGCWIDITDRKRAEEALRENQASFANAQRIARLGNWDWNIVTNELHWSDEIYSIFGLRPQKFGATYEAFLNSVHPDDRNQVEQAVDAALNKRTPYDIDHRIVLSDGEVRIVHEQAEVTFDDTGKAVRMSGTVQDITDMAAADERFRRYFDLPLVGSAISTPDKRWIRVNDKLCDLLGYSRDELLRLSWSDLTHPDDLAENTRLFDEAIAGQCDTYTMDKRFIRKDGEVLYGSISAQCVRRPNGDADHFILLVQDITERKRVESALRDSEKRFRDFTETASDWFWEMDENLRYTYISDRFEDITGVPINEVVGLTREELYDRHMAAFERRDREKWRAHYQLIKNRQAYRNVEVTWCYPDGTERTFVHSGKPVFDEAGAFKGYRGTGVEITDHKKAEAALRESEKRFRSLFEQGAAGMAHAAPDGRYLRVNRAYSNFTGYASSELIGKRFDVVVHPDDLQEAAEHRQAVLDGKPVDPMHERRYRHKSGEERWGLAGVAPLNGPDGALEGYIVQVQDLTERKRAEEALQEAEARLRSLLEHSPVAISLRNTEGRYLMVNPQHRHVSGWAADEIVGKTPCDLFPVEHAEAVMAHHRQVLEQKTAIRQEETLRLATGEHTFLTVKFPIVDRAGNIASVGSIATDITERKRAEEEILKLNAELERRVEIRTAELQTAHEELLRRERLAALGQLTGTVSHELRNPLGAMRTAMATVKKLSRRDEPMLARSIEIVERSIARCDNIIGDLLDYSRARGVVREPTALDGWLAGLLDEYEVPPGVTLRRDLRAGVVPAFDRDRLRRVVVNLLDNACQAMAGDGEPAAEGSEHVLSVATRQAEGRAEISIGDTGPGIPAEAVGKIFEPLYSTKAFGFGLGLPIVKQILDQHDGGIEVERGAGRGTHMVVWMPLAPPLQSAAS